MKIERNGISGITNFINVDLRNNIIKRIEPKRNAIIIDFEKKSTGDGRNYVKQIITVECMDDSLYEEMKDKAIKIWRENENTKAV